MGERVVIVGSGGITGAWIPALQKENVQVSAMVDLNIEAAKARIAQFGMDAEASTDMLAMLKRHKPDFVLDCTIPEAHCKVSCAAMKAGFPVVSEKPMAASMAEARRMVRTSEETGMLYMVSQSRRWDYPHERIRRSLNGGSIGDITTANCDFYLGAHFGGFRDEMPSPLILDMSIHHFDLVRYLTGKDPVAVYAKEFNPKGSWYKGDVAASCIFEMTDGVVFTYRGSWCSEGFHTSWQGNWRFIGDKGSMLYENDAEPRAQVVAGSEGFNRPLIDVEIPDYREDLVCGMHGALRDMLAFLRTGAKPQTECHDNIKSLAMVFSAIESSSKGRRVPVRAM